MLMQRRAHCDNIQCCGDAYRHGVTRAKGKGGRMAMAWSSRTVAALCFSFLLVGCTTLNKSECLQADWRTIGLEDGAQGHPLTRIGEHRKACAQYGVRTDLPSYEAGHREGARLFCIPRTAYQLGLRGGTYHGICPAEHERDFVAYYQSGQEVRRLRLELNQERSVLGEIQAGHAANESVIATRESLLVGEGLTRRQRLVLLNEIKVLTETRVALEAAISGQEAVIEQLAETIARRELTF
ncbi:MAG: DUF2799 domain-containing protein [Pseudomonadota bacterium]|nr:MAG: DUF2799 domain-containing protein [Pseudomonadota bacterium]